MVLRAGLIEKRDAHEYHTHHRTHFWGRGNDHVDVTLERHVLALGSAGGPWPGSETSWRDAPQSVMIMQVLTGMLLVCLGLLLGEVWSNHA